MISSLRGSVLVADSQAVIDVNGVGYGVAITPACASSLTPGEHVQLHTHLVVREDSLSLFGFLTREELTVFESLIGVTGVGPRSALAVLSSLTPAAVFTAVVNEDDAAFRSVSGIGPKTAKLIIVQLAGKVAAVADALPAAKTSDVIASVISALVGLGWPERVARDAVSSLETPRGSTVNDVLRMALATLASSRK